MKKYIQYSNKLYQVLDSLRQPNGVFRASASVHYNATWIRDNYWNAQPYLKMNPEKYMQTCHTHLDFLKKWEYGYDHKISWLIKDPILEGREHRFLHPKVNYDGSEIVGLKWQFLQIDTLAYFLLLFYNGHKRGLEVFRDEQDFKIVQLLIKALEHLDFCNKNYAHSWEEELGIFTSNLGLIMRALECSHEMGFEVDREILRKARRKFYGQFPYERTGRDWDLTLLFLTAVDGILKPIDIEDIIQGVETHILRPYGVIRYQNDVYKPFQEPQNTPKAEMQWCMGLGYLALAYLKVNERTKAKLCIDQIMQRYPDGCVPEGVNEVGYPCDNTPLAWSVSMSLLAIQAYVAATNEK